MHDAVFIFAMSWIALLTALVLVVAARTRRTADRLVALDGLSSMFVSSLTVIAVARGAAGYLDVALMLALLGFTQTVAGSSYCLNGRVTP